MRPDPVQHRRRIAAMQPIDGWQSEPPGPFMEHHRLICAGTPQVSYITASKSLVAQWERPPNPWAAVRCSEDNAYQIHYFVY